MLSAFGDSDVRHELSRVTVPTLVLHARGDLVVPIKDGIDLATGIKGSRSATEFQGPRALESARRCTSEHLAGVK
jgi:pimeloyl-ACP methyl ester carboxylesterase